jgi:hypothetical protein
VVGSVSELGWERGALSAAMTAKAERAGPDYCLKDLTTVILPYRRKVGVTAQLAIGVTGIIHSPTGSSGKGSTNHVVVVKVRPNDGTDPTYQVWCGDRYLQGACTPQDVKARQAEAIAGMGGLRKSLVADNGMKTAAGLRKSHPATSDASHFWSSYTAKPLDLGCKHVRHFMYEVERTQLGGCDSLLTRIDEAYEAVLAGRHPAAHAPTVATPTSAPSQPVVQPAVSAVLESDVRQWSALTREILDVAGPQVQEKQPVRILGPAGYGKTYGARRLGRSGLWNEFYEHAIYPDHEASDLLGGPRPVAIARADGTFDRQWIHQDSEPVKAFRAAAAGRTVFLLIDEMGNARRDVLNVLKNMINPEDGMYRLQTGRAVGIENGIARGEVLEAPVKNLTIVGTSNIGGEYEANTGDPAVVNRFYSIFLPIDHAEVLRMVHKHAVAKGLGRDCAIQIERFYANMQKLLANSTIERLPNPRDFAKVIAVSKDEAQVPAMLARFGLQWVSQDLDGAPNAAQLAYVVTAVKNAFTITDSTWSWRP